MKLIRWPITGPIERNRYKIPNSLHYNKTGWAFTQPFVPYD